MKILMVSGSPFTNFMYSGVALLSALAKQKGHDFKLFDLCNYNFDFADENVVGESLLEFKKVTNPERAPKREKRHKEAAIKDFMDVLETYHPDIIGFSAFSSDVFFGKYLFKRVYKQFDIPVIAGGVYPTVDSEDAIAQPWVDMINVGQGEESFMELLDSYQNTGTFDTSIKNIWFKKDGKIIRNPLRPPLTSLDSLPYFDWSIYEDYHFYRPFVGNLYRYGSVEISRGCPLDCTFCINSYLPRLYGMRSYVTKSVDRAISEIVYLKDKYNLEFFRFQDENFLLKKMDYLKSFVQEYRKKVNLPFLISTTASSVTEEKVEILKDMNCVNVGIGLETGNEGLRTKVLNKKVPDKDYRRAYKLINDAGIRTAAQIMFGIPHETVNDYPLTIKLVKDWNVDTAHVAIFYPFKGSRLREYAIEENLLSEKEITEFENSTPISTRVSKTLLKFSQEQIRKMDHYRRFFTVYKELPEWLWPLVDACQEDNEFSRRLSSVLRQLVYKKRFS